MSWSPLNVLLLAGFLLGTAGGAVTFAILRRRGDARARPLGMGIVGLGALYLATLVAVSLTSHETVLDRSQLKRFCGFYIDCHLGVGVGNVARTATLGADDQPGPDVFYLVTLQIVSGARQATLSLHQPKATLLTDDGAYQRDTAVELRLTGDTALAGPVAPGGFRTAILVFRVPATALNARLLVTEGHRLWPDRLLELLLIGDEDSLFHGATTFRLT